MSDQINSNASVKALRADAKKNREKLLKVAHTIFVTEGISFTMEEIARRAEVGIGTVYRHFPTKEALFEAVIVNHKSKLLEESKELLLHSDPREAFFHYLTIVIREGIANKAITDALVSKLYRNSGQSEIAEEFWKGIDRLLIRAQHSATVRQDIHIEDVKILINGILQAIEPGGRFPDRVVAILFDGLRNT